MAKGKIIEIVCKHDGFEKHISMPSGCTIREIIEKLHPGEIKSYVGAFVNRRLQEIGARVNNDAVVELLPLNSPIGYDLYKRSIILLMLKAARDVLQKSEGDYRIEIMYSLGRGFFCRLEDVDTVTDEEFLAKLKARMQELVDKDIIIEKKICATKDMREEFLKRDLPAKSALLKFRRASKINMYELDGYIDYYYGYMVPSTGYLTEFDLVRYDDGFVLVIPAKKTLKNDIQSVEFQRMLKEIYRAKKISTLRYVCLRTGIFEIFYFFRFIYQILKG